MKTFSYEQVAATVDPLKARLDGCAHGEGSACETLDTQLECSARVCLEFAAACKSWAMDVFHGEVVFDAAAERRWRMELAQLHAQATELWHVGRAAEQSCWDLPGQKSLGSALWELQWLGEKWETPQLAVGPMARTRLKLSDEEIASVRAKLAALPPYRRAGQA